MLTICACGAKRMASGPQFPVLSTDPLDRMVKDITDNNAKFPGNKIVVYEFQDIGGRLKAEGRVVAERLTTKLVRTGEFEVIERGRLESVLQELNLSASGVIDEKTAIKAGEILGAGAIVTGTLVRIGGKFEINARAITVAGGKIIAASMAEVSEASLRVASEKDNVTAVQVPPVRQQSSPQRQPLVLDGPLREQLLPDWEIWPGLDNSYGRFSFSNGQLSYYLSERQHDGAAYETGERTGYFPGLLLSRKIAGKKWEITAKADYRLNSPNGHWFSSFIWLGADNTRPSGCAKGMDLSVGMLHEADHGSGNSGLTEYISFSGGKILEHKILYKNIRYFKIRRDGSDFYLETSEDGLKYVQALYVKAPVNIAGSTQKIVLGGQCFGNPSGSYATYEYVKLNGRPLF